MEILSYFLLSLAFAQPVARTPYVVFPKEHVAVVERQLNPIQSIFEICQLDELTAKNLRGLSVYLNQPNLICQVVGQYIYPSLPNAHKEMHRFILTDLSLRIVQRITDFGFTLPYQSVWSILPAFQLQRLLAVQTSILRQIQENQDFIVVKIRADLNFLSSEVAKSLVSSSFAQQTIDL